MVPGGCRGPCGVAGFLGAGRAARVVRGRAWAGRAASAGAVWFPVARRLARWPSPRRPVTSAAAWWPVALGWCSRSGPSQCSAPHRIGRVGDDHVQARVGGHLDQPVTEPGGGDARDGAAEPASPPAARGPVPVPLASLGPGRGEVQVLDHDRLGAVLSRGGDEAADRGPQPPVTGSGGQPGQVERDGGRGAQHVAVRREDRDGEMRDVDVHGDDLVGVGGQVVCLLGRNGAGKTTTMRTIMGLVRASSGSITFNSHDLIGCAPYEIARLGVGFVPDDRLIFRDLTVRENLEIATRPGPGAAKYGWTVEKIYDLFPILSSRAGQLGGYLSGGEQQMLTVGRTSALASLAPRSSCARRAGRSDRPARAGWAVLHRFCPDHRYRRWPSPWTKGLGTPNNPAIRFTRGTVFAATLVRYCYGLSGCWPPCTDLTGLPANGGFYFQAFNELVVLPVAGYDYNSDWTLLLAGLSPTGMAASLAALVRPCSCPASDRSWQGAPKTRSTPCHRTQPPRSL